MPTLVVAEPFTLKMDPVNPDGTPRDPALPTTYVFPVPGTYDAPDEVAQHWFTPPHLEGYEPPTPEERTGVMIMAPVEEPPEGETVSGAIRGGAPSRAMPTPPVETMPNRPPQTPHEDAKREADAKRDTKR